MDRMERAAQLFESGYNCAQAAFLAFQDVVGVDEQTALRLSSSFGGGMGRMREVCGAVSGMLMAAGCLYGYASPEADEEKKAHYHRVQALAGRFREEFGSILCRELLENPDKSPDPTKRSPEFYKMRPCTRCVAAAAGILEEYMKAHPVDTEA